MPPDTKPLTSREKKLQAKKIILNIIEQMLEENLSKEWFLKKCPYLCQADYDDVVQERSIIKLCGYPLCSKPIETILRQKYHICKAANKIYDITERKNFCSNQCYKASNFLKAQLHSLPLYMRKNGESSLILKVLSDSDNRGSAGEEVLFHHTISKDEVEKTCPKPQVTTNLANMLQEDIKNCTEHLANLEIKEKVYKETFVFETEEEGNQSKNFNDLDSDNETDILEHSDDEDKVLFPDYDNTEVLSNKHMPVSNCKKKAVLIEPVKPIPVKPLNKSSAKLSLDFLSNVFWDWFTEDTMKYLLGEKQFYSIKADNLFRTMVSSGENEKEKLNALKDEYINLCLKIDKLPEAEEELSDASEVSSTEYITKREEIQNNLVKIASEADSKSHSVKANPKRRTKRKGKSKSKSVSFAPDSKNEHPIETAPEDANSKPEPVFPLVDSISQNTLRRQVLISKLKNVYFEVLAVIGLHYRNIKEELKNIVNTFSLTPTNIIFKPKELKCIGIVLFRILTKTVLKEFDDDAQFTKLCENSLVGLIISEQEINNLAYDLINPLQFLRLKDVF